MAMRGPTWRRKWAADALADGWSPVPSQIVSNEEHVPLPPTREQQRVAHRLREMSRRHAKALGVTRRQFLGSSCGMAAAFLAMNEVFGHVFDVSPVEAWEVAATADRPPLGRFVFDVQTHHVAAPRSASSVLRLRSIGRRLNPDLGDSPVMAGEPPRRLAPDRHARLRRSQPRRARPRRDGPPGDSIWWGSPRWQIDAFRRFTMPDSLVKTFKYAPLTPDVKARILGLNAAAVFGVDPNAALDHVPNDFVARMKAAYLDEGPRPSLTQYGWVR